MTEAAASLGSGDPFTIHPRRIVTEMLGVAAFEVGDPVAALIEMEADDAS